MTTKRFLQHLQHLQHLFMSCLIVAAGLLAGCGSAPADEVVTEPTISKKPTAEPTASTDGNVAPATVYPLPDGSTDVVIRFTDAANQPDPLTGPTNYPSFTLYGDGTLITVDPHARGFGPRALQHVRISPVALQRLVADAERLGALDPLVGGYGFSDLEDGDTSVFFVDSGSRQERIAVYDLSETDYSGMRTKEENDAHRDLVEFRDLLRDWETYFGDDVIGEAQPFEPASMLVFGVAIDSPRDSNTPDFPIDIVQEGQIYGEGSYAVTCYEATGPELAELRAWLEDEQLAWTYAIDGWEWRIDFRHVWPDEAGCSILDRN